jgi:ATP dependent DNA ligase domain
VFLYAFDLIELNGDDLRRNPLEVRKTTLATVLTGASHGIWYNDHVEGDGQTVFRHACKLGLEGIVSKRKDSPYCSGRSPDWLKDEEPGALGGEAGGGRGLGAGDVFAVQACVGEPPIRRVERRRFTTLSPTALSSARIFHAAASPVGSAWMWTLIFGHHEDRTPTHGYAATREAAMRAFAKSWRRE